MTKICLFEVTQKEAQNCRFSKYSNFESKIAIAWNKSMDKLYIFSKVYESSFKIKRRFEIQSFLHKVMAFPVRRDSAACTANSTTTAR